MNLFKLYVWFTFLSSTPDHQALSISATSKVVMIRVFQMLDLQIQCNPTQNPAGYFMEFDNLNSNIYIEMERSRLANTILQLKNKLDWQFLNSMLAKSKNTNSNDLLVTKIYG